MTSELEMSAEGPLSGDYRVSIVGKCLYDESTLFTKALHLTMSLVQIKNVHALQLSVFIDLSCHSN